jgi:hypothetical protein
MTTIEHVLNQIRAEFMEMPGMRLQAKQVQRLCGIEETTCQLALDLLLASNFLCLKPDGTYARVTDGYHPSDESLALGPERARQQEQAGK